VGGKPPSAIWPIFKARATSILRSLREERARRPPNGKSAKAPSALPLSAHLMGTLVFGFLTLKVKQRDGLLRGEALNFSNEFSGDLPRVAQARRSVVHAPGRGIRPIRGHVRAEARNRLGRVDRSIPVPERYGPQAGRATSEESS
jgi:hypothetical protein